MGVAEDLYNQTATAHDVLTLAQQRSEALHLDYKERWGSAQPTGPLTKSKSDEDLKDKISKALSGFANSDGGVLVLGVRDDPRELRPIAGLHAFEESVQAQLSRLVLPSVPRVVSKRVETDPDTGMLLLLIPASDLAPHRAQDREYYIRSGESFVRMEHFQIADMFGRRHVPVLRAQLRVMKGGNNDVLAFLGLENMGRALAKFPLLEVIAHSQRGDGGYFFLQSPYNKTTALPKRGSPRGINSAYAGGSDDVVHARHALDVVSYESALPPVNPNGIAFWLDTIVAADGAPPRPSRIEVSHEQIQEVLTTGSPMVIAGT